MLASGSWHMEQRLTGSRAPSPLDVLGRTGLVAAPQQPSRQLAMPTPGVSDGVHGHAHAGECYAA
jgi:hypothetical protein